MAVDQVQMSNLTHRYRGQVESSHRPSHILTVLTVLDQPNSHFHSSTSTTTANTGRATR